MCSRHLPDGDGDDDGGDGDDHHHYDKVQVNGHGCDEDRHHAQEPGGGGGGGVSEAQLLNPSSLQVDFPSFFSINIFIQSLLFTCVIISFSRSFLRVICCGLLTFFPSSL